MVEIDVTQLLVEAIHQQLNPAEVVVRDHKGETLADVATPAFNSFTLIPDIILFGRVGVGVSEVALHKFFNR
jgi:hypothetical protein